MVCTYKRFLLMCSLFTISPLFVQYISPFEPLSPTSAFVARPQHRMGHVSTLSPPCFGDPQDGRSHVATLPTCGPIGSFSLADV